MDLQFGLNMSSTEPGKTPARSMRRAVYFALALLLLSPRAALLRAQEKETADQPIPPPAGLRVSQLSGYVVYFSNGQPEGYIQPTATQLPSDVGLGGSIQLDWSHITEKSQVMFMYAPSYTGRLRYSAWNALNHLGSFSANRHFGKWETGLSARGDLSNLSEYLFQPTVFASVASVPVNFNDLASAVLTGTFTNAQLASLLTGAPLVQSPAQNLFFGERMLTANAQTWLAYKPSKRLAIKFTGSAGRIQHISDNSAGTAQNAFLIPRTSLVGAGLDVTYARSARTQVGVTADSSRIISALQDAYITTTTGSFGRTMGRHWFLQLNGGLGIITPVRRTLALETKPQPVFSGSLGYRTLSHTFLGSYDRTVSDAYGLGANTTSSATGSWRWARPGRSWWIDTSASWQKLAGASYANTTGWRFQGGFSRAIASNLALVTQYVYLRYSEQVLNLAAFSQSAVRLSVVWSRDPEMLRQRPSQQP